MRAAVCERYGPPEVVKVEEVPTPEPGEGQVRIAATTTTVNSGDARLRAMRVPRGMGPMARVAVGFTKPRQPIFGFDVAGRVDAVGRGVTGFQVGDRVVGSRGLKLGCHAEHVIVAEDGAIVAIPDGVGDHEALAPCFGGLTALHYLDKGKLEAGQSLLVNGASGAVGAAAVQLAKHMGAEVTGVCGADHAELVKDLGADHVIDYAAEDFTGSGHRYDVIMDTHGSAPYSRIKGSLAPGGRFLMVVGDLWQTLEAARHRNIVSGTSKTTAEGLRKLLDLVGSGELRPVIDSVHPFEQITEAHRRVDGGHKAGSVVVTFAG
jgi:NADPH:quinone reductase-like Zn-dependent oxidoreductase